MAQTSHEKYLKEKNKLEQEHLCTRCKQKMPEDYKFKMCKKCSDEVNASKRRVNKWLRDSHICVYCGRVKTYNDEVYCPECREKNLAKKERELQNETEDQKKVRLKRYNDRYQRLKEQGLCVTCGKPNDTNGIRCSKCKSKQAYNKKINKKPSNREMWPSWGLCYNCGKEPIVKGKKLCAKCLQNALDNLEKAHEHRVDNKYWRQQDRLIYMKTK